MGIRPPESVQDPFKGPDLGMVPEYDCRIPSLFRSHGQDPFSDLPVLGIRILTGPDRKCAVIVQAGPDLFGKADPVLPDHFSGSLDNGLSGPEIDRKKNGPAAGKVCPEPFHAGRIGASEAVDGLIVVSYGINIAAFCCKQPYDRILARIDVLEFIHQYVGKALLPGSKGSFVGPEQMQAVQDHVIIVQHTVFFQKTVVVPDDPGKELRARKRKGRGKIPPRRTFVPGNLRREHVKGGTASLPFKIFADQMLQIGVSG